MFFHYPWKFHVLNPPVTCLDFFWNSPLPCTCYALAGYSPLSKGRFYTDNTSPNNKNPKQKMQKKTYKKTKTKNEKIRTKKKLALRDGQEITFIMLN